MKKIPSLLVAITPSLRAVGEAIQCPQRIKRMLVVSKGLWIASPRARNDGVIAAHNDRAIAARNDGVIAARNDGVIAARNDGATTACSDGIIGSGTLQRQDL